MSEICLGRLRMIQSSVPDCTPSCSESQTTTIELASRSESILSSLIDNLIECWENIISELYLSNGSMTYNCQTNGKTSNTLFWKGCIENPVDSILLKQTTSTTENTSKLHILPKHLGTKLPQIYVWSVASATSIAEFMAWNKFMCYLGRVAGMSLAKVKLFVTLFWVCGWVENRQIVLSACLINLVWITYIDI